jgi:uncharacterized protein
VPALRKDGDRIFVSVRLTPRASANAIRGERDGALLVRVTAAPVDGAANQALVLALAKATGVPPSAVRIERGASARRKLVSLPAAALGRLARMLK